MNQQQDYQKTSDPEAKRRVMKKDFESYMKVKSFARSTIEHRLIMIGLYFDWLEKENLEAAEVKYNDLLLFMKYCQRTERTQRTIKHYMITVRHYYDHLVREGQITSNPAKDIQVHGAKRKVLYHILESHELHQLYNQYPSTSLQEQRDKVLLGLLVYQGIRAEELDKLQTGHIKLKEGKIDVLGGIRRNGRLLQLESHQVLEMYDYILQVRPKLLELEPKRKYQQKVETDLLFIGEGGHRYSISNFVTRTMVRARKINPSLLNAKQIRASVITKWLKMYNREKFNTWQGTATSAVQKAIWRMK